MTKPNWAWMYRIAFTLLIIGGAMNAAAQNTTSSITGRVTGVNGEAISGAAVTITHTESGSVSNALTDADGHYTARGLRPGVAYSVVVSKGALSDKRDDVYLQLAETANIDVKLGAPAVETIVVEGRGAADKFSASAMGAGTSIGRAELDAFASIQRNLQDYARLDPRVSQTDKDRGEISVAGQNSRYNSVTIDGVAINDTFGLEANGLPTTKQPISIDALQSVQVNVSNYDVTQKGYTGANINAVTKSGTNQFKGSVTYVTRNDKYVGKKYDFPTDTYTTALPFKESTKGFNLGGPIIKDKLFFFAGYEEFKSTRAGPTTGPIGSSLTNVGITTTAITSAQALAKSQYSIDIGGLEVTGAPELIAKDTLLKLDWNINDKHRASVRYSKTDQLEPIFPNFFSTPTTALSLSSDWYTQGKIIKTIVGQWFAEWTPSISSEVKISSRDYHSEPKNNSRLPLVQLQFSGALPAGTPTSVLGGNRNLNFGTERSRHLNILDTKTTDGYAGLDWILGDHDVKLAADYSNNKIFNAFLQDVNGNYLFNCQNSSATYTYSIGTVVCSGATASTPAQIEAAVLENFRLGRPFTYTVQVAQTGSSLTDGISAFNLKNYGSAVQDTWNVNSNLTVTYGARLDVAAVAEKPKFNAAAAAALVPGSNGATLVRQSGGFGIDNSTTIDGQKLFQPRFGFNYTFDSKERMQVRGGFGLFEGAAATVWLSNPFSNSGVTTRIVGCGGSNAACPVTGGIFSPNPDAQITNFAGAVPAQNVDLLAPGLGQPSVWKANLAFEHELPWNMVLSAEYLYTKTKSGLFYQQLNLGAPIRIGTDGRELYYTNESYNPACWNASGGRITTAGTVCANSRTRALSNPSFNNVILANKTSKGRGNVVTLALSRPIRNGWGWSLSYTKTDATEVSPLTSSTSNSNWASRSVLNQTDDEANSVYLVKDRFNGTINWQHNFFAGYKTEIGFFVEGRTGKPYSWTFANDANGDGQAGNDLFYVPSAPGSGEVIFAGDTATNKTVENAFWAYVNSQPDLLKSAGRVTKRNDSFSPWTNSVDVRISQQFPSFFKEHRATLTFDILNFGNLLNKRWGHIDEIVFQNGGGQPRSIVNFLGLDPNGKYFYGPAALTEYTTRQVKGESQWALQATFKYEF